MILTLKKQAYVQYGDHQAKQPTSVRPDETDVPLYFQRASLDSTDLCLALIELQREGRLEYGKNETGIYYARA